MNPPAALSEASKRGAKTAQRGWLFGGVAAEPGIAPAEPFVASGDDERPDPSTANDDGPNEGAYDVVVLGDAWGLLSLLCFALSMTTRYGVGFLPPAWRMWDSVPPLAVVLVPLLSGLGLVAGRLAVRREKPGLALGRLGFLFNLVVFSLSGLLVVLMVLYRAFAIVAR